MTARLGAVLLALLVLSGCLVGRRTTGPDADTDGLPDALENDGWDVIVTRTQFSCFGEPVPEPDVATRIVTSNPLREDSDYDGVLDEDEFRLRGDPMSNDTDQDGLTDGDEIDLQQNGGLMFPTVLALNRADSDKDCLGDADEVAGYVIPGIGLRATDPTTSNSDGDGWADVWEINRSHTDPNNADTDGDGASDRSDADPLRDLWMRLVFESIEGRDLPPDSSPNARLLWHMPAVNSSLDTVETDPFAITEGQSTTLGEPYSPGFFDLDDAQGGANISLSFGAFFENGQILDINPHNPGRFLTMRLNAATTKWSFALPDGSFSSEGQETTLETSQARFVFRLELAAAP